MYRNKKKRIASLCITTAYIVLLVLFVGLLFEGWVKASGDQPISLVSLDELSVTDTLISSKSSSEAESAYIKSDGNSISGCIKLDDAVKTPVEGYPVVLLEATHYGKEIRQTFTDQNGNYLFNGLDLGEYVVKLETEVIGNKIYTLAFDQESLFTVEHDSDMNKSFSSVISVSLDQADHIEVNNINAIMHANEMSSARDLSSELWDTPLFTEVTIDGYKWYVMKKQTVDGVKCVLLVLKGSSPYTGAFGNSTTTSNYEGSLVQGRMTAFLGILPTIQQMAVIPQLGSHSSTTVFSNPTSTMAEGIAKDILFALSYADVYALNGNTMSPLLDIFRNYYRFFLRTSVNNANVYGVNPEANTMDAGIHYLSTNVRDVAAVWVATSRSYDLTVHFVDSEDTDILSPQSYLVESTSQFEIEGGQIPFIPNYVYIGWKISIDGIMNSNSVPVVISEIIEPLEIYLVYAPVGNATLSITKQVEGFMGNKETRFEFRVYLYLDVNGTELLTDSVDIYLTDDISGIPDDIWVPIDGSFQFFLKHDQTIVFGALPAECYVQVIETVDPYYDSSFVDSATPWTIESGGDTATNGMGLREVGSDKQFFFTNQRVEIPETGIDIKNLPTLSVATVLMLSGMILVRRRQR
ncbi:MAG: hypothetical protein FWG21_03855 [Oscillospiraceae bacterium]|nr:hypothetical protein [Oscillospiraceae bacterium]